MGWQEPRGQCGGVSSGSLGAQARLTSDAGRFMRSKLARRAGAWGFPPSRPSLACPPRAAQVASDQLLRSECAPRMWQVKLAPTLCSLGGTPILSTGSWPGSRRGEGTAVNGRCFASCLCSQVRTLASWKHCRDTWPPPPQLGSNQPRVTRCPAMEETKSCGPWEISTVHNQCPQGALPVQGCGAGTSQDGGSPLHLEQNFNFLQ